MPKEKDYGPATVQNIIANIFAFDIGHAAGQIDEFHEPFEQGHPEPVAKFLKHGFVYFRGLAAKMNYSKSL